MLGARLLRGARGSGVLRRVLGRRRLRRVDAVRRASVVQGVHAGDLVDGRDAEQADGAQRTRSATDAADTPRKMHEAACNEHRAAPLSPRSIFLCGDLIEGVKKEPKHSELRAKLVTSFEETMHELEESRLVRKFNHEMQMRTRSTSGLAVPGTSGDLLLRTGFAARGGVETCRMP